MKTLPSTDVLIIGSGWTGLLMAKETHGRPPLSIHILPPAPTRHDANEKPHPVRQFGAFLPGTGVGGTGEHWGAVYPRLMPDCFEMYSKTVERYGKQKLPEDHSIQDWGITYDELEPYYARSEREVGISGKAGNLNGKKIERGN